MTLNSSSFRQTISMSRSYLGVKVHVTYFVFTLLLLNSLKDLKKNVAYTITHWEEVQSTFFGWLASRSRSHF